MVSGSHSTFVRFASISATILHDKRKLAQILRVCCSDDDAFRHSQGSHNLMLNSACSERLQKPSVIMNSHYSKIWTSESSLSDAVASCSFVLDQVVLVCRRNSGRAC